MKSEKSDKMATSVYPRLEIGASGSIVLMSMEKVGTVVFTGNGEYEVGTHRKDWCEDRFSPYIGSILLEN